MNRKNVRGICLGAALMLIFGASGAGADDWPQWGGPTGDFKSPATGLANSWPEAGPAELWRRDLGEGYSAIIAKGEAIYTHYRKGERESVIAMNAGTGETLWEHTYEAPTEGWRFDRGAGPHSTPAIAGDRIFAIGGTGKIVALNRTDGSLIWEHDLMADHGATFRHRGYSSSPLIYRDSVLVSIGGEGKRIAAFRQEDGSVLWQSGDDDNSYSSPILIELNGRDQLVAFGATRIIGLDPLDGRELWSHPHATRNAFNISTPLWADDGLLFVSSAYDGGGRVLRLTSNGNSVDVEELWFNTRMKVHFGTAIRLGDAVYASSGDFGPAPLTAVDIHSGEVLWRDRAFKKASVLYADGKLIVLDEDGVLGLVKVSRTGLEVLARAQVFDSLAWTAPTLVGSKLYLRSRRQIVALELAAKR